MNYIRQEEKYDILYSAYIKALGAAGLLTIVFLVLGALCLLLGALRQTIIALSIARGTVVGF